MEDTVVVTKNKHFVTFLAEEGLIEDAHTVEIVSPDDENIATKVASKWVITDWENFPLWLAANASHVSIVFDVADVKSVEKIRQRARKWYVYEATLRLSQLFS